MRIGVPKEVKNQEWRVAVMPSVVEILVGRGHQVVVETNAGLGAGFADRAYEAAGASIVQAPDQAWAQELVIKVKEPLPQEYQFLRPDLILFTYLHLAADRPLTEALMQAQGTAIAYETVQLEDGRLPLLTPMSVIAGRLSVQMGAKYLEKQQGGKGLLLGGIPGVGPGQVVILGGGIVGTEAARTAIGLGAKVAILDINVDRLAYLEELFGSRVELIYSSPTTIEHWVLQADLLVGGVLIPGQRAPKLVSTALVQSMEPGSVIMDVAVDQGGCIETLEVTSYSNPTYTKFGIVHCGIPNLPGAVPQTSTQALGNSTLPYILELADRGLGALGRNGALAKGLNVQGGKIMHPAVQNVFQDLVS